MEAASAAVTVCLTDCIRFWAFPTNISVASISSSVPENLNRLYLFHVFVKCIYLPCAPNIVAFTVDKIFSCVPIVGIRSHTCNRFWRTSICYQLCERENMQRTVLILLSVHSLANSLAKRVTSSEDSAIAFAIAIRSLLLPLSSWIIISCYSNLRQYARWIPGQAGII